MLLNKITIIHTQPEQISQLRFYLSSAWGLLFPFFSWLTPLGMPFTKEVCHNLQIHNNVIKADKHRILDTESPHHSIFPLNWCSSNFCTFIKKGKSLCELCILKIGIWTEVLWRKQTETLSLNRFKSQQSIRYSTLNPHAIKAK